MRKENLILLRTPALIHDDMLLNVDHIALEQALERLKRALGTSTADRFPSLVDEVIAFVGDVEAKLSCNKANKLKVTFEDGHEMWGDWDETYDGIVGGRLKLRMINDDRKRFIEWKKKYDSLVRPSKLDYSFPLKFEDEFAIGTLMGCFPIMFSNDENGIVKLSFDYKKSVRTEMNAITK